MSTCNWWFSSSLHSQNSLNDKGNIMFWLINKRMNFYREVPFQLLSPPSSSLNYGLTSTATACSSLLWVTKYHAPVISVSLKNNEPTDDCVLILLHCSSRARVCFRCITVDKKQHWNSSSLLSLPPPSDYSFSLLDERYGNPCELRTTDHKLQWRTKRSFLFGGHARWES